MREEVRAWLEKSEEDYELARDNFEIGHESAAMFFSHQSVEKALKALQIDREGEKSFSHNLVVLAQEIDVEDNLFQIFSDLNAFYTGFRYPDEDEPEIENHEKALEKTGEFLEWTKKQLEK